MEAVREETLRKDVTALKNAFATLQSAGNRLFLRAKKACRNCRGGLEKLPNPPAKYIIIKVKTEAWRFCREMDNFWRMVVALEVPGKTVRFPRDSKRCAECGFSSPSNHG